MLKLRFDWYIRELFESSKQRLAVDRGSIESLKGQTKDSNDQVSAKRKPSYLAKPVNLIDEYGLNFALQCQLIYWNDDCQITPRARDS